MSSIVLSGTVGVEVGSGPNHYEESMRNIHRFIHISGGPLS